MVTAHRTSQLQALLNEPSCYDCCNRLAQRFESGAAAPILRELSFMRSSSASEDGGRMIVTRHLKVQKASVAVINPIDSTNPSSEVNTQRI